MECNGKCCYRIECLRIVFLIIAFYGIMGGGMWCLFVLGDNNGRGNSYCEVIESDVLMGTCGGRSSSTNICFCPWWVVVPENNSCHVRIEAVCSTSESIAWDRHDKYHQNSTYACMHRGCALPEFGSTKSLTVPVIVVLTASAALAAALVSHIVLRYIHYTQTTSV